MVNGVLVRNAKKYVRICPMLVPLRDRHQSLGASFMRVALSMR